MPTLMHISQRPQTAFSITKTMEISVGQQMSFYSSALDTVVTAMNNKQVPTGMPFDSVPEQQGLPASHMDFLLRATTCDVYYGPEAGFTNVGIPS